VLLGTSENCPHTNFVQAASTQISNSTASLCATDYVYTKTLQFRQVTCVCIVHGTILSQLDLEEVNVGMVTYVPGHVPRGLHEIATDIFNSDYWGLQPCGSRCDTSFGADKKPTVRSTLLPQGQHFHKSIIERIDWFKVRIYC
jgi:hypothetical protein